MTDVHEKEWGRERWIRNDHRYCMKELSVNPGYRCSLHMHKVKTETFYVVHGIVGMEVGDLLKVLRFGETVHIPRGVYHRFSSNTGALMIECSTQHFEEDSYRTEPSGKIPEGGTDGTLEKGRGTEEDATPAGEAGTAADEGREA